jgi:hypothetical protein
MRATDGTLRFSLCAGERQRLVSRVVAATVVFALAIAMFLLERRVVSAFSAPLPTLQLWATGILATAWALFVRELSRPTPLFVSLALAALLMLALACSSPGARIVDWLVWPAAMFAVVLCPSLPFSAATPSRNRPKIVATDDEPGPETDAEQVLQQFSRVRTADGIDAIRGTLMAEFAASERQTTLYIAFCPPFERLPQMEVNVTDDSDASVKLTQVLHNGAQLDVRLLQTAAKLTIVTVEFFASDGESPLAV